jgi:hypothetical protein
VNAVLRSLLVMLCLVSLPFPALAAQQPDGARVRRHPLYCMLVQLDRQIAALRATLNTPGLTNTAARSAAAANEASRNLRNAAAVERASAATAAADQRTEAAALRSLAHAGDGGDLDAYKSALASTQTAALSNYSRTLNESVARAYRRRAAQFDEAESTLAFNLERRDAALTMPLRVKIYDLHPDAETRTTLLARLNAILKRESEAVAALRAGDRAALAAYRTQILASAQSNYASEARDAGNRTADNLRVRSDVANPDATVALPAWQVYRPADFEGTARSFDAARTRIAARASQIAGIDSESKRATLAQIAALQNERRALYAEISAETNR